MIRNALIAAALAAAAVPALAQAPAPTYGTPITLEQAKQVAAAAEAEARRNNFAMSLAIVEPSGQLVLFHKIDGTQYGSTEVAFAKARSAALFRRPTKAFEDAVAGGRNVILALPGATPVEGGVLIESGGRIIGAIGVSGGTGAQDAQVGTAGAAVVR